MRERELETEQNCNILTPTLIAITAFLFRSPGLLNRGPGGSASLGHGPHSSIFSPTATAQSEPEGPLCWVLVFSTASYLQLIWSPTHLISNWLNFLCTELYNNLSPLFFLRASRFRTQSTQSILDRMHMLFTQVPFLFWQLDRVGGQYATNVFTNLNLNSEISFS